MPESRLRGLTPILKVPDSVVCPKAGLISEVIPRTDPVHLRQAVRRAARNRQSQAVRGTSPL